MNSSWYEEIAHGVRRRCSPADEGGTVVVFLDEDNLPMGAIALPIVRIGGLLSVALRDRELDVVAGSGWRLPDAEFAPDIAIAAPGPPDTLLSSPPLLVVEVLSRSTRHIDLGRKRELYAAGGLPWYWLVDLANDELVVLRNDAGAFVEVQRLTSGTTIGPVEITLTVAEI